MAVLATPVFAQRCTLFGFLQGFVQLWLQKYLKFHWSPQVLVQITRWRQIRPVYRVFRASSFLARCP